MFKQTNSLKMWLASAVMAGVCGTHGVLAGPGDGVRLGNVVLHPFLDVSGSYDSNVGLSRRSLSESAGIDSASEDSDTFLEIRYGLNLDYQTDAITLGGSIYGYDRQYSDNGELDNDGIGQNLNIEAGSKERLAISASQSYQVVQDYSRGGAANLRSVNDVDLGLDRADRLERTTLGFGLNISRDLSDKVDVNGGFSLTMIDYEDDALFDTDSQGVSVGLGYHVSEKSSAFVNGSYQVEDSDAFGDDGTQTSILVGLRTRGTEKLNYNVGIGYVQYEVDDAADGENIDEGSLSYNLGLDYAISAKLALTASARNGYSATSFSAGNAREVSVASVGLAHRTTEALTLGAAYSLRGDEYVLPITVEQETAAEDRLSHVISGSINFAPPGKWYSLYLSGFYETSDSEFSEEDYDQFRASIGASVYY